MKALKKILLKLTCLSTCLLLNCGLTLHAQTNLMWVNNISKMLVEATSPDSMIAGDQGKRSLLTTLIVQDCFPEGVEPGPGGSSCGTTFELRAVLTTGTGTWSRVSGPGTASFIPDANDPEAVMSVNAPGHYVIKWEVTDGECMKDTTIDVTFYETPFSDPGLDLTVCGNTQTLDATPSIGSGYWRFESGPGKVLFSDSTQYNTNVLIDAYGDYTFKWTEYSGICYSDSNVTISFFEQPDVNGGMGGVVCGDRQLLNASPSVGIGEWTRVFGVGSAVFTPNANAPDAVVRVTTYGNYNLKWTETNGVCSDDTTLSLNFKIKPEADAGRGGETCDTSFALDATLSTGIGSWSKTSGPGEVDFQPFVGRPDASAEVSEYGTYTFTWTETNSSCSDDSTIEVSFYEPPQANAGADASVCDSTYTLQAELSTGSGTWTRVDGPGTVRFIPDAYQANARVVVSDYGTQTFLWTEINGICEDADQVQIQFFEPPQANAGEDLRLCGLTGTLDASSSTGYGTWEIISGHSEFRFNDINAPGTDFTADTAGVYQLKWTVNQEICSDSSTVSLILDEPVKAIVGDDMEICGMSQELNATDTDFEAYWQLDSGPGEIIFQTDSSLNNAEIVAATEGTYALKWLVMNGTCRDSNSVNLSFYEQPLLEFDTPDTTCGKYTIIETTDTKGQAYWNLETGAGTMDFSSEALNQTRVQVSEYGNYSVKWTVENTYCISDTSFALFFAQQPEISILMDTSVCGLSTPLSVNTNAINTLWQQETDEDTLLFMPASDASVQEIRASDYGRYKLKFSADNNYCVSDTTLSVVFHQINDAEAGSDQIVCNGSANLLGSSTTAKGSWTMIENYSDVLLSGTEEGEASVSSSALGRKGFIWTVGDVCVATDTVYLDFKESVQLNPMADTTICKGSVISLQAVSNAAQWWLNELGEQIEGGENPEVSPLRNTLYKVMAQSNSGCSDSAYVMVYTDSVQEAYAGEDIELYLKTETQLSALSYENTTGTWSLITGVGIIEDEHDPYTMIEALDFGDNIFVWTILNGVCPSSSDEVKVSVLDLFVPNVITPNGDGKNDYFTIAGIETLGENYLTIFNRWGDVVYETTDYENDWDGINSSGNQLPTDTYFYILSIQNLRPLKGTVTIK